MSYSLPNKKEHLFDEVNEYIYPNVLSNKKHISGVTTRCHQNILAAERKNINCCIKRSRGDLTTYSRESKRYFVPRRMRHVSYREGRVKHTYTHKRKQEKDTFKIPRKIFAY